MTQYSPRLPSDDMLDASPDALRAYFEARSKQMLLDGFSWTREMRESNGCPWTTFARGSEQFCSIYVPTALAGQGLLKKTQQEIGLPIVTVDACSIVPVLEHLGIPHAVAGRPILQTQEYLMVERHYGDRRAFRSAVFLQNHIDEGLAVMKAWGASEVAMRAFCLHPMVQADSDFAENHARLSAELAADPMSVQALALAVEYRRVANAYLAKIDLPAGGVALSELKDVNDMLVGDKIQNKKDFLLYHMGDGSRPPHPNAERLAEYFDDWIQALGAAPREAELLALISGPRPARPAPASPAALRRRFQAP